MYAVVWKCSRNMKLRAMVTSRLVDPRLLHPRCGVHVEGIRSPRPPSVKHTWVVLFGGIASGEGLSTICPPTIPIPNRTDAEQKHRAEPIRDEAPTS